MADPDPNVKESKGVLISGKIMVASIIMLFAVVVFVMLLNLYAQWFWGHSSRRARARRRRFVFTTDQDPARVQRRGLEPAVIHSLPVFTFQLKKKTLSPDDGHREDDDVGLECAVCLCEFEQGEKARLLPACRHSFHVDCIDMWFHSHSTCPLCRTVVVKHNAESHDPAGLHRPSQEAVLRLSASAETAPDEAAPAASGDDNDGFTFPTNVLFWGNQSRVDSGCSVAANKGDGTSSCNQPHISIDIPPRRIAPAGEFSSPERLTDIDDLATAAGLSPGGLSLKSPTTRMRILGRLLSREKRPSGACASPSGDVEQGVDFVRV